MLESGAGRPLAVPAPVPDAHSGRLFRKYLLLILSLVTIVLLASSGINLYFSYQENRAALGQLQREKALGAASRIEQYIRQVSRQLEYASLQQLDVRSGYSNGTIGSERADSWPTSARRK